MVKFRIYAMYCCMLCSIVSCAVKPKAEEQTVPNSVVVIFKDAPMQASTKRFGSSLSSLPEATVEYVDITKGRVLYIPRSVGYDTITVPAYNGYAELSHRNQVLEDMYYLIKAGDTVLFTYGENLRPQLQSLTNESNTALYNLPFFDKRAVQPTGWSTHAVLNAHNYQKMYELISGKANKKFDGLIDKYKLYAVNLDSLATVYNAYIADFSRQLDAMETNRSVPQVYINYYRRQIANQATRPLYSSHERLAEHLPYMTDSLMHYISYYRQALCYRFSIKPMTKYFDAIAADTLLQPLAHKAILHNIMAQIESDDFGWHAYAPELKKMYREKYVILTGDSSYSYQAVSSENVVGEYANDLLLKSLDGKQVHYADILAKYKGKVIYVDFWASWCGPCRAGMPAAKELREAYKGKDVVFLYLAINDTESAWRGAVKSMKTEYLGENYMVLNASESKFLPEIKHRRIPHLLLYNRLGKLVSLDAPRPESEEIRAELNSLL